MAKVKKAKRKTAGKFYVAVGSGYQTYGDLLIFKQKPKADISEESDTVWNEKKNAYDAVTNQIVDYSGEDQNICSDGFTEVTGREVKEGECWRVDFKLTRVDRAAQAARAKKAKRAKRR